MRLFRSAACAALLLSHPSAGAFALDDRSTMASGEGCDIVCQMQVYLDTDHMVHLVPKTQQMQDAKAAASPIKGAKSRAMVRAVVRKAPRLVASLDKIARPVKATPTVTAPVVPPPPIALLPQPLSPPPVADPQIPGSAPRVTVTQFAGPVTSDHVR